MKKLLFLIPTIMLFANNCNTLKECTDKANFYHFDKEDDKNAANYYKVACDKFSDYISCKSLSDIYKYSQNNRNEKLAGIYQNQTIKLVKEQCENNNASACYDYANFSEVKYASTKNYKELYKKAFNLYKKECDNKNYSSCYFLANMYFNGTGTEIDENKAFEIYENACLNKDGKSCYEIAQNHKNKYLENLRNSCQNSFEEACKELDNIK
ncbi:tetratricopeptide repeat protein [Campylobacter sp. MG1]|uniref:tetratricopeptide repeat protein n=1 Tax=Campylobacter sp. MG1 TaxID=2976332 RepID=UPI00226CE58A|nr:tetratricopeptide repeat protein [Campylobacter sp. MG1]